MRVRELLAELKRRRVTRVAGRLDEAFDVLFAGIEAREVRALNIRFDPYLEPLHSDPRWGEALRAVGF